MVASMAVMARESWTDERLNDLKENVNQRFDVVDRRFDEVDKRFDKVDARFNRVEADLRELRADMKSGFESVDEKFAALQSEMNLRFEAMQRTMIICFVSLFASIVASVIGGALLS
jgi:chaperonin cofactor prefoldin